MKKSGKESAAKKTKKAAPKTAASKKAASKTAASKTAAKAPSKAAAKAPSKSPAKAPSKAAAKAPSKAAAKAAKGSSKAAKADATGPTPSQLIDRRIEELGDWRGDLLGRLRALVKEADPEVVETWKWRGVPVWEHDGIICTGETYKTVVKMTFAKGAALPDPAGLFNSSLEGNTRRAIDFPEGGTFDAEALKTLVRDAVALNRSKG